MIKIPIETISYRVHENVFGYMRWLLTEKEVKMIQLFKDGDAMAIRTDCLNEDEFNRQFSELFSNLIDEGAHAGDWDFQLRFWLQQYADICCSYRGYKSEVDKRTVLLAGSRMVPAKPIHEINLRGGIFNDGEKVDIGNGERLRLLSEDEIKEQTGAGKNRKKPKKADPSVKV